MKPGVLIASLLTLALILRSQTLAQTFTFTTGDPDGLIATASRTSAGGKLEIESADDFFLSQPTLLGTYSIVINGAFVPSSCGGPPSTIDNSTFDFLLEDYDGTWYPTFLPFSVRIYGAPLSAVPEPAWYGLIGSGTLLLAAAFRRRVRHKFAPLPARSAIRHS